MVYTDKKLGDQINAYLIQARAAGTLPIGTILWWVPSHFDHIHVEGQPKQTGTPPQTGGFIPPLPDKEIFDMLAPCSIGDEGEHVKALQIMLWGTGFDPGTIDKKYGPATSAALLACRKSVGSSATSGDTFDQWAYQQLHRAHTERYAQGGISPGGVDDKIKAHASNPDAHHA
jgi:hypothetical protein